MALQNLARSASLFILAAGLLAADGASARLAGLYIEAVHPLPSPEGSIPYELVTGRFDGELDPAEPGNAVITDIAMAPRNARGQIEYSATFAIARPVDPARASGVLFYDVPNRGNGAVGADPDGHIRVMSGWQGDLPEDAGLQTLRAPKARTADGKPLIDGDHIWLSGVVAGLRPGETLADQEAAYDRAFKRIGGVLERAGASFDGVVELTTFHTDLPAQIERFKCVKNRYIRGP